MGFQSFREPSMGTSTTSPFRPSATRQAQRSLTRSNSPTVPAFRLTVDAANRRLYGTPNDLSDLGSLYVMIIATDDGGLEGSVTFHLRVNRKPTVENALAD